MAVPAPYAGPAVAHSLGLPEAATYALPGVRAVAEAPIVEQVIFRLWFTAGLSRTGLVVESVRQDYLD